MGSIQRLFDRGTPDTSSTEDLPISAAAEMDYLAGRAGCWTDGRAGVGDGVRARALVICGEPVDARRVLAGSEPDPSDLQDLAAATWAASRVGPPSTVAALREVLAALPDGFLVHHDVPLGPVSQLRGLLAAASGDLGAGVEELREAVTVADARAPLWGAIARLELARVLRCAESVHGRPAEEEWRRLLEAARTFFAAGGCASLQRRAVELAQEPDLQPFAAPGLGHLVEGEQLPDVSAHPGGGVWTVGFGVAPPVTVRDRKGLAVLRELVANGPHALDAVELASLGEPSGEAGELDPDRARSRVSKLVRRTIGSLHDEHPLLAAHLARSVQTGYACSYRPSPGVCWRR